MSLYVGIGFSNNPNAQLAIQDAAAQAKNNLAQTRIDMALVFMTAHYSPEEVLPIIYEELHQTNVLGCTAAGLLFSQAIESQGIMVVTLTSENIKFETGYVQHLAIQDMQAAGKTLAQSCVTDYGQKYRKLLFFFADGLLHDLSAFVAGAKEHFGPAFPLIGAGSCDAVTFQKSYQFFQDQVLSNSACAMLLGGDFDLGISCQHGWKPLGKPRIITKSEKNIIHSIDGKSAFSLYEDFIGAAAQTMKKNRLGQVNLRYPLGLHIEQGHGYVLRNVIDVLDDGSLVCQDNVHAGTEVHIMMASKQSCLLAAEQAAYQVREQLIGLTPRLIIVTSSLVRAHFLGRAAIQEVQIIRNILGVDVPLVGFYSANETYTARTQEDVARTEVHNSSVMITAIH